VSFRVPGPPRPRWGRAPGSNLHQNLPWTDGDVRTIFHPTSVCPFIYIDIILTQQKIAICTLQSPTSCETQGQQGFGAQFFERGIQRYSDITIHTQKDICRMEICWRIQLKTLFILLFIGGHQKSASGHFQSSMTGKWTVYNNKSFLVL